MIEEHYYWQKHPLMLHDDINIYECIYETSLSHLKSSCFPCSLFCSDSGGGSPFTYWMKEHMDDYFDAYYIILEKHYRTWDPHLCHWSIFDMIFDACVYGPHDDQLTWVYKRFHDSLIRYLLDENLYDVFM